MVVKGNLIKAQRMAKTFKGKKQEEKLHITLSNVELSKEERAELEEVFKDAGKKFTPTWVSDFEGYVNIATQFQLPAKWVDGEKYEDIEDLIAEHTDWRNAEVRISLNLKEGAVYPKAIIFDSEGEEFDAFADFEE